MRVTSRHLDDLLLDIDPRGQVKDRGAVGFFEAKLTILVVTACLDSTVLAENQGRMASTRNLHRSLLLTKNDRSIRRCNLATNTKCTLSIQAPGVDRAIN